MSLIVKDLAIYVFFNVFDDFAEQAFNGSLLAVETHHPDLCSLPFILVFELRNGDIVFFC